MMLNSKKIYLALTALLIFAALTHFNNKDVELILLTWDNEDTSHTMTVNYISNSTSNTAIVYYDTSPKNGDPDNYRYRAQGEVRSYPGVNFTVYSTRLESLTPDASYYFVVGDKTTGYSNERKFKTIPEAGTIRFISGGDAGVSGAFEEVCKIAAKSNPHFAIIGGDIAYGNGNVDSQQLWLEFLDIWQSSMVTPEGYTIPVIAAIGNHEVDPKTQFPNNLPSQSLKKNAPFYHLIFHPADDKTFFKRRIGLNNILFILDTDHIYPSDGTQLEWMRHNFSAHKNDNFLFANYHVPLYPSHRNFDGHQSVLLRSNWLQTFDQHHIDVAFENHEHTLKKSKLLRGNKVVDTQGTIYIGDGNWGRPSRSVKERWYLEATRPVNHVWAVTLNEEIASFKALTIDGVDQNYTFEIKASNNLAIQ